MLSDPMTLYKLMVLYLLKHVSYPLTEDRLSEFFIAGNYTDYFRLKEILDENGIGDIIEVSQNHSRRLNVSRVKCDLYDFLSGDPKYRSLFAGMYMLDYSWAEVTTAGLLGMEGKPRSEGGDK